MDGNGIERLLGKIDAKLDAAHEKDRDFREDIQKLYGATNKNEGAVGRAHTRLDGMTKDVDAMKKKSAGIGGASGGIFGIAGAFIRDFFTGGSN